MLGYAAEDDLPPFVEELTGHLVAAEIDYQLVLVGNYWEGREDRTPQIVRALCESDPRITPVLLPKQGGMGFDIKAGFAVATGEIVGVIDGDGQVPPLDVVRAYRKLCANPSLDLVKTCRRERHDGPWRRFISAGFNSLFYLLFPGVAAHDINSKPKLMRRALLDQLALTQDDWFLDAELMIQARRLDARIGEISTVFRACVKRQSFVRPSALLEFLNNMARFRLREFRHSPSWPLLAVCLAVAVLTAVTGLRYGVYADERWAWIATIQVIHAPNLASALGYYHSANPLLIGYWSLIAQATSFSLPAMRSGQILLALLTLCGLYRLARRSGHSDASLALLQILAAPYFLVCSLFLYSDVASLLPVVLVLLIVQRAHPSAIHFLLLLLAGVAALYCRALNGAAIGSWLLWELYRRSDGWQLRAGAAIGALACLAPLALFWGCLTPDHLPPTSGHQPWIVAWAVSVCGLLFWPWVVRPTQGWRWLPIGGAALYGGLAITHLPETGPLGILAAKAGPAVLLLGSLTCAAGTAVLFDTWDRCRQQGRLELASWMAGAAMFAPALRPMFWFERYALFGTALMPVMLRPLDGQRWRRRVALAWCCLWLATAGIHSARWMGAAPRLTRWSARQESGLRVKWTTPAEVLERLCLPNPGEPSDALRIEGVRKARELLEAGR